MNAKDLLNVELVKKIDRESRRFGPHQRVGAADNFGRLQNLDQKEEEKTKGFLEEEKYNEI